MILSAIFVVCPQARVVLDFELVVCIHTRSTSRQSAVEITAFASFHQQAVLHSEHSLTLTHIDPRGTLEGAMSSYDAPRTPHSHHLSTSREDGMITAEQFQESMRLVRMQIAVPISVLIAMGANLICALALKPGLGASQDFIFFLIRPLKRFWALSFCLRIWHGLTARRRHQCLVPHTR